MDAVLLMVVTFVGYILMYRFYGRFISKKIFKINSKNIAPSIALNDGVDYQPTKKTILFGHHFTSIAGTGPIVGPAIAVIWGWLPAVLWVFIGSIFIGGLHDFGTLIISMRNEGKTLGEYSRKYLGNFAHYAVFIVSSILVLIVIAIFGVIISLIFNIFPGSVLPVWLQIPIALFIGYMINSKGQSNLLWSIIGIVLLYGTVIIGAYYPVVIPDIAGIAPTGIWTILLLIYAFVASVLPVKTLLQPRDYINSHQLIVALLLLFVGIIASAIMLPDFGIVAPAIVQNPDGAPSLFPFIFVVIACGAVSGFHSLVSSGSSSKQISNEADAQFIGYGSMLSESVLAIFVIIATTAGIGILNTTDAGLMLSGEAAWNQHYHSWEAAAGLGSKIDAFVTGSSNMISSLGIPQQVTLIIMGVFVASFAGTTLDTSTRLQRYIISEIIPKSAPAFLKNRFFLSGIAVITAGLLAFSTGVDGKGALTLWPIFGNLNQILAMLGLIIITSYLRYKENKFFWVAGIPALFMSIICICVGTSNMQDYFASSNYLLIAINSVVLLSAVSLLIVAIIKIFK
ncbi:MAG: carbon starvation protein A, partial [Bacteroidetes bacterium 4572_77]